MLYCSIPTCSNPFNPNGNRFCQTCGSQALSPLFRNRYRVIRLLGKGGFGRTYEATDADRMDDPCVIKQFVPQVQGTAALEKATELFKQEAKRLYDLGEHPQIPRLVAYFEQDNCLYLVQEFIEGQNLLQELTQQGAFSEEKIKQLLADLLPVLKFVHERGVIHRDIKPENIMRRRKDGKLMLIDFGVSKQVAGTLLSRVGTTVGTLGYVPIEQMRGQVYPASDLYSLGVTCVRLLTQCMPKEDGSDDIYDALNGRWIWTDHLPRATTISSQMQQVLDKLLQDYVKNRYKCADEVLQTLKPQPSSLRTQPSAFPTQHLPLHTQNSPLPSIQLISSTGVDYRHLEKLLITGNWKEADWETLTKMLQVRGKTVRDDLTEENIKNFPCEDLCIIDHLWVKYSQGRFGFSVQKRIWIEQGSRSGVCDYYDYQAWYKFGDRVGWYVNNKWQYYSGLTFTSNAPVGHFPARVSRVQAGVADRGWRLFVWDLVLGGCLFSRIEACGL